MARRLLNSPSMAIVSQVRLVYSLASVAVLLSLPDQSLAQFLDIDVGPYQYTLQADSFAVPPAIYLGIGITATPLSFKYIGIRSNAPVPNFIVVSPASGTAPTNIGLSINPNVVAYMQPGPYGVQVLFRTTGESPPYANAVVELTVLPPPPPVITSIVNSASLQPSISPGAMASIFGANLGTPPISGHFNDSGLYPTTLGNTTVTFNGTAAPLLYVSTTQINAVVPYELAGQKTVSVIVAHDSVASPAFSLPLTATSPAIFTVTQDGKGQGAILNDDPNVNPTPNSADNHATKGIPISIYATGGGLLSQTVQDGSIPLIIGEPPFFKPTAPVSVTIAGQPAQVIYAGAIPYEVFGMLQVNAIVPNGIGSGPQPVVLTIGANNNASQQVTVAVK
jgi:trimeric autotransporter adhesin